MKDKNQPNAFGTKDHWAIVAMGLCGHIPVSIGLEANEAGGRSLMYHFNELAWTDYDDYMRGVPREPFSTLRRVEDEDRKFKNNLTRFLSYT